MKINIVTLFPDFFESPFSVGVLSGALKKEILQIRFINPRSFTSDVHKTIDDRPFGGGDGMVMMAEPLSKAVDSLGEERGHVVTLSPSGRTFNTEVAREYVKISKTQSLTFICGRYSGIDQRFIENQCDEELSVGDYILSGGEPGVLSVVDSVARLLPGVLGNETSPEADSFFENRLECPVYTRPREVHGMSVPETLLSGHTAHINQFREAVGLLRTYLQRKDLIKENMESDLRQALEWAKTLPPHDRKVLGLGDLDV